VIIDLSVSLQEVIITMSVASTSSFTSSTSGAVAAGGAGKPAKSVDLEAKAAAASVALVEKMRAAEAAKAAKAKEREEAKAAKEAEKAAEKEAKAAEKAAAKAAKEAEKAAEKEAKAAEKAAKKAAKEAEEAAKPKRPVGRPRKEATGGAGAASTASSVLDELKEPLPSITPAMRKRIAAAESVDLELHPSLFGAEPTTVEEATAEIGRLRAQLAALSEAFSHQKAVIRGSLELLSAAPH
jgi:hypothetical protein